MADRAGQGSEGGFVKTACAFAMLVAVAAGFCLADDNRPLERGTVEFTPTAAESSIAERFRLAKQAFAWEARRMQTVTETLEVWDVTFPSPVKTLEEANNTIHC